MNRLIEIFEPAIERFKEELTDILHKNNDFIHTDTINENYSDKIYSYLYDIEGYITSYQIKAIRYRNNNIEIFTSEYDDYMSVDEINKKENEMYWYPLYGGDILGWFTSIEIAEKIESYIK